MSERIGYGRVSTRDQNPDSQRDALTAAGCTKVFVDRASGKLDKRPELDAALEYLRPGDTLVITRLSRAARSLKHLLELTATLRERGVELQVLKQGIDTTTPTGRLAFHMLGAIDEFLRELIVEGTHEGLEAARARGRKGGRPPAMTDLQIAQARRMYDERGPDGKRAYTVEQIAETFGVGRATIYRHLGPDRADIFEPRPARTLAREQEDVPGAVTKTAAPAPAARPGQADTRPQQPPVRDETRQAGTESAGEDAERWQAEAEAERAEFERRLRPVPDFGEGYQMAEWPGTGRYYLVYEGERIGHAVKTAYGTQWEAHSHLGTKIPGSSTYRTRRDALIQVALHHQHPTRTRSRRGR